MELIGSYNNNSYGSDNIEAVWVIDDFNNEYVEELGIRKYDVQRIRRSAALALDYKFNATYFKTQGDNFSVIERGQNYRMNLENFSFVKFGLIATMFILR